MHVESRYADPTSRIIAKGRAALAAFDAARPARQAVAAASASGAPGNAAPAATPVVRAVARKLGVDLATVKGTGTGGRITPKDVRAAAPAPQPVAQDDSYPEWMRPAVTAKAADTAPRAGRYAGTAYPADWER